MHIFHHLHHIVHHGVSEGVGDFLLHQPGFYLAMLYGVGSSCAISHDKSARAEVYSAIIPDYYDKNISKLIRVYLTKDRFACCCRRFAIVVSTKFETLCTKHIGITHMTGIVIFLAIPVDDFLCFIHTFNMVSKGEELTPFLGVKSLTYDFICYCFIFVKHSIIYYYRMFRYGKLFVTKVCG